MTMSDHPEVSQAGRSPFRRLVGWAGQNLNRLFEQQEARRLHREGRASIKRLNATIQRYGQSLESLIRQSDPQVFSVLIPARGAEPYIAENLRSILSQSMPPSLSLEVIVAVDGCSGTFRALTRFLDQLARRDRERVTVLNFEQNYGPYVMQNSLLYASRGAHVHIVGADDVLAPDAILQLWAFIGQCRACSSAYILRPMGYLCDERLHRLPGRGAHQLKGALIFSKNVLEKLGGFAPWLCAADTDFLRRAEGWGISIYSLPAATYLYRQHGVQMTSGMKTGMRSGVRAFYWRLTQARLVSNGLTEKPVVAWNDPLNALGEYAGQP